MIQKAIQKATLIKQQGFMQHYKKAFADAQGIVSIGMITAECVSILVLICILVIIPLVASNIQDNLPEIKDTSAWANYTDTGANVWGTALPLINVACIVVIIGLVLHVIYSLKTRE